MSKVTTLKDIAEAAEVSITTVSDVLNGKSEQRRVSAACTKKVLAIAKRLQYRPHINGRALVQRQTYLIGVLAYSMHSSFWGECLQGLIDRLQAADYHAVISLCENKKNANRALQEMHARAIDGFICLGPMRPDKKHWTKPAVFSHGPVADALWARVDDDAGMYLAVEHLCELGHKRIAVLGNMHSRIEFAMQHCQEFSMSAIQLGLDDILEAIQQKHVTAICCCTDQEAIQCMTLLQAHGISVPSQCSVIGYDDLEVCQWVSPSLSTIRQPQQSYGTVLAELLLDNLKGQVVHPKILQPQLQVRQSTAQAP